MKLMIATLWRSLRQLVAAAVLIAPIVAPTSVFAQAGSPGPGGVNVGFDFNWNPTTSPPGATGYTATFIATSSPSGATLNTCIGVCNFVIAYSVGGTPQPAVLPGGAYETWTPPGRPPGQIICDTTGSTPNNTAPLTLFNCFNQNSFGQDFTPTATGTLSAMTMAMTCLNPSGTPLKGLVALLYQVNGNNLPATPLAQIPVDLTTCPTLTTWNGHTFTAGDFANIPLNFPGVTLTSGVTYGVYFSGLVPGAAPPGAITITITPTSLPSGNVGTAYGNHTLAGNGGTTPYTFAVTSGSLPPGLTLSSAGVLSGTPTATGT